MIPRGPLSIGKEINVKGEGVVFAILPSFSLIVIFIIFGSSQKAFAESGIPATEWMGYAKTELAYRYPQNAAFTKFLNLFQLELHTTFSDRIRLVSIGRVTYNAIYDLEDFFEVNPLRKEFSRSAAEISAFSPRRSDALLREFYLDWNSSMLDLRLGKQIVRWGLIEGFRITDAVNPMDFTEFILREVGDRYIPLWMAKGDFYFGDISLETLFIPDLTFHQAAPAGTEWEEFQIPPGTETPTNSPINWEWGVKVSENILGWDSSFSYLYNWDQFPGAFRGAFGNSTGTLTFTPRYSRLHNVGLTTSKNIAGAVMGFETAYVHGKYFETGADTNGNGLLDSGDTFGEMEEDYFVYGVSADVNWYDSDITLQYSQTILPHYEQNLMTDQVESGTSLFIRREWLNSRILTQFSVLYFFNRNEALIRPRIDYKWSDHLKLSGGGDFFSGHRSDELNSEFHFIGFFKDHDRIIAEVKYSF
ncbi:MAG: hypothetical protein HY200_03380 [Nitrospirae bacterium]|nr:hypothetical protein [Nitrospirota bacterium]MBI3593973.1 hypothetical protein [Nitrospirota bacterium]